MTILTQQPQIEFSHKNFLTVFDQTQNISEEWAKFKDLWKNISAVCYEAQELSPRNR